MPAIRITAILVAVGCCLAAAAAYASTRPAAHGSDSGGGETQGPLPPRIVVHPDAVTTEATAEFDFRPTGQPTGRARPGPTLTFECRLDERPWQRCEAPVVYEGIARGSHRFSLRAVNRSGTQSVASGYIWRRNRPPAAPQAAPTPELPSGLPTSAPARQAPPVEPPAKEPIEEGGEESIEPSPPTAKPFTIEQIGGLGELFPGAPAETIGVRIENPNQDPIAVTSLTASIAADPPGCPAAENFTLAPAAITAQAPLTVPAESTVSLPEAGLAGPTIAMLDLPTSQDACQAAELQIALSGEASG